VGLLVVDADIDGQRMDVRTSGSTVTAIGRPGERLQAGSGDTRIDADGGALLPGLHDHHLHLLAMAAAEGSVRVGPPEVADEAGLRAALRVAAEQSGHGRWLRATGYHESVAGPLDRDRIDALVRDRPVRIQHRSGALWMLNSAAIRAAGLEAVVDPDVERTATGRLTGRLWRWDDRLRARLPAEHPDLATVSARLARFGITGVTDATPDLTPATVKLFAEAVAAEQLAQELTLLGAPLDTALPGGLRAGPYKLLLRDHDLPSYPELVERVAAAHGSGRAVAVHCVTREALLLTLAVLEAVGPLAGDRIEHAAVVPAEIRERLAAAGVCVVTQPAFVCERGDEYLAEVDPEDVPLLYPFRSLQDAGVAVAASSDAPFGTPDPWSIIAAAAARTTRSGQLIGAAERVSARTALAGYLTSAEAPGAAQRRIRVAGPADFCLLDAPLACALASPAAGSVRLTVRHGRILV
jgi:predicted amidohydrolase YtcJ